MRRQKLAVPNIGDRLRADLGIQGWGEMQKLEGNMILESRTHRATVLPYYVSRPQCSHLLTRLK